MNSREPSDIPPITLSVTKHHLALPLSQNSSSGVPDCSSIIVDPIDGTKEFIHGTDEFVVSIGLVENGRPVLGVIYNPVKEEIFYSSKGEGSYLNDLQIFCNEYKSSKEMILLISAFSI